MTELDQRSSTIWDVQDANRTDWREDVRVPPPPGSGDVGVDIVTSVFGRSGDVVALLGDYESDLVSIEPPLSPERPYGTVRLYLANLSVDVDGAVLTAQSASNDASVALTAAEEALSTATAVDGKAQTALDTANAASVTAGDAQSAAGDAQATASAALPKAGGTMTGPIVLAGDGTAALNPVTKQQLDAVAAGGVTKAYVDAADALLMPKAGGAFTGPVTVAADPTVPLGIASKAYVDAHSSAGGASVTISATAPSSPTAGNLWWNSTDSDGNLYIFYNDGTSSQWVPASAQPQGQLPVAVGIWYPGVFPNSATLMQFVSPDPWTLPAACAGSQGSAGTAATATTTISIQKNGSAQGSVNFAASATTATFTLATAVSFAAGDRLTLVGPATADATLANVSITLKGTR